MKFIAIEREVPGAAQKGFGPLLRAEAARAYELYQADKVRELYFRADWPGVVLVLECADLEEARQVANSLPLVSEGLIEFELIPLLPYPHFAMLFEPSHR